MIIERLKVEHAAAIADCFQRVYGDSYANELFYDVERLAEALDNETLCSVGAIADNGRIMGHMAMTLHSGARHAELGNTVVDPDARGGGLAWKIGAALTQWTIDKGFAGYLHYPTTDHHIMQQQSVKQGFETGLMLGYIPRETDGQVSHTDTGLRGASTIVFEPLAPLSHREKSYLPQQFSELVQELAAQCGVSREWRESGDTLTAEKLSKTRNVTFPKRDLLRLEITRVGQDAREYIGEIAQRPNACKQIDFRLDDEGNGYGVSIALEVGFVFCGWLPGFRESDVLRLQQIDLRSDLNPGVVNRMGERLCSMLRRDLGY